MTAKVCYRYMEILLREPEFPSSQFSSLKDLSFSAIKNFSSNALRSGGRGFSHGAEIRPVEAQYQDEFYRACFYTLGRQVHLTSEWTGSPGNGRVDFQIKAVKWGIECVREGNKLKEHIQRFQKGGRYYGWISSEQVEDYILLNFRTSMPTKREGIFIYYPILILNADGQIMLHFSISSYSSTTMPAMRSAMQNSKWYKRKQAS